MRKTCKLAAIVLCCLPVAAIGAVDTHVEMKIVKRDGSQQTVQLTRNHVDASPLWGGIGALLDTISTVVNFWDGNAVAGAASAAATYADVRDLVNQLGDKTANVLATGPMIDIDQTQYLELTLYAHGDDGIGHIRAATPRLPAFSTATPARSRDYKNAQITIRVQLDGVSHFANLLSGPYVVDFFAKEGSDAVGGPDGCHICLAAHHLITLPLTSSVEGALSRLPQNVQQAYRRDIVELARVSADLRQTYADFSSRAAAIPLCSVVAPFVTRPRSAVEVSNCIAAVLRDLAAILQRRQTLQEEEDNLLDRIFGIFWGGQGKHRYHRPRPIETNVSTLK